MQAKYHLLFRAVLLEVIILQAAYAPNLNITTGVSALVVVGYLAGALALFRLSNAGLINPSLQAASFVADIAVTSFFLYATHGLARDLYLAYFLVILATCFLDDLRYGFVIAGVACFSYGSLAFPGRDLALQPHYLLSLSLLLVTSFFSTYMIQRIRDLSRGYEERLAWLQRLSMVGKAMSGVLHEVKTPLGTILLTADYIQEASRSRPQLEESLKTIRIEAQRAVDILSNYLEFAKPARLDLVPMTLCAPLEKALDSVRLRLEERNIKPKLSLDSSVRVLGSERHLIQAFTNILLNAVEAMPLGGSLEAEISVSNGRALVRIVDTGVGIDPDLQARLGEPFMTSRGDCGGSGIGLMVVRWIVLGHNGDFDLSSPGIKKGSQAVLTFPLLT